MKENTIVTACDKSYLWGAYILVASLRLGGCKDKIHVLVDGFSESDRGLLMQFNDVKVIGVSEKSHKCMAMQKPDAILTANTELVTWIDSDCMILGDISKYLRNSRDEFQIRVRGTCEMNEQYKRFYCSSDNVGEVPEYILRAWSADVGELHHPRMKKTIVNNCFVLNQDHMPFIKKWKSQMNKVLSSDIQLVDSRNKNYFMSDESVLSSMFAFSYDAPEVGGFMLDKDPSAYLVHFSLKPKPWQGWNINSYKNFDSLMNLLKEVKLHGLALPHVPYSLREQNKKICFADAYIYRYVRFIKGCLNII